MSQEESASWRIVFTDSQEDPSNSVVVADFHTSETSSAAKAYPTDRDALALPRMPGTNVAVHNQGKIRIEAQGDAADTVESEESNGFIPIKLINNNTGSIRRLKLRFGDDGRADFSGFNSTNDVVLNTSNYVRLGAWQVPAGHTATLDAGQPVHLYLGDDT